MREGRRAADGREVPEREPPQRTALPPRHALLALQRSAGNQATTRMVQRLLEPGYVTKPKGTGLHKFKQTSPTRHSVRTGGVFGTGIKKTVPFNSFIFVDPARANVKYIWAEAGAVQGYVKKASVQQSEQIGGSSFYVVPVTPQLFQVYDMSARTYVGGQVNNLAKPELMQSFAHALGSVAGTGLTLHGQHGLLESLIKSVTLGVIPDPALWQLAAGNVATVQGRVTTDRAQLIAAGLITPQHALTGVKFTGADFHKGGQAPFFLIFTAPGPPPDERKVVYKPGSLHVDRLIFGRGNVSGTGAAEPSLAEALNPANDLVSQYTILAQPNYGYMEFVGSDGPQNAADVLGIYKSLAANMALSYIVGLEDVHQENVLMLKDRVQVIDMEATTGQFTTQGTGGTLNPADAGKGFLAQLWGKALNEGIKQRLFMRALDKSLTAVPPSGSLAATLTTAFEAVLETASGAGFDAHFDRSKNALAGSKARVVPMATQTFYELITMAEGKSQVQWDALVDTNPGAPGSLVQRAKGNTGNSDGFLAALLKSPATLTALQRGEVPYYYRYLNDDTQIFDEANAAIPAAGLGKVSGEIDDEMDTRRNLLQAQGFGVAGAGPSTQNSDAVQVFVAQMLPIFSAMNDHVADQIAAG